MPALRAGFPLRYARESQWPKLPSHQLLENIQWTFSFSFLGPVRGEFASKTIDVDDSIDSTLSAGKARS